MRPPVDDSETVTVSPRALSRSPIRSANDMSLFIPGTRRFSAMSKGRAARQLVPPAKEARPSLALAFCSDAGTPRRSGSRARSAAFHNDGDDGGGLRMRTEVHRLSHHHAVRRMHRTLQAARPVPAALGD